MMSVIVVPLSSSSAGTMQSGFRARNAGVNCSPLRKSTCTVGTLMPFSARKMRTRRGLGAVAQSYSFIALSFDHLIGASEYRRRNCEAKRLGRLDVDHQLIVGRRLHRKVGGFLALEDAVNITSRAPEWVNRIRAVGH